MNILSIVSGVIVFCLFIAFFIYTGINIKKSKKLTKIYKNIGWLGVSLLASLFISVHLSREVHIILSLIFVHYLKLTYSMTFIFGVFFLGKKIYSKIKGFFKPKFAA
ncbi:hypothetical protein A6C39_10545 [Salmonella enterica]|uniref:Uncharacterized protein n=2 Tax=Salmonella enterica TaxID=28901 RepID=A0A724I811_SALET|nr:hypothetical protein [Salmonella enterica]EBO3235756.1 hypothetical protein [Salmonella enterica subsp. enterica serovar Corvallis]EJW4163552.1 hypothetical protein [Escherichia coli]ELS5968653.1 hypothetical protein [Salmonella enterica subsp. enterica serovar Infantis]EBU8818252.1 hypothetical protein [Salmonella enterica subsp. enterica serovar Corvallis]EBV4702272.1 hypothetical protein [Salmonella enterica subsp. enterica serovar Corvallis]